MQLSLADAYLQLAELGSLSEQQGKSLRWFGRYQRSAMQTVVDDGVLRTACKDWPNYLDSLTVSFGLRSTPHFFHVEPYRWCHFLEPQITRGLAYHIQVHHRPTRCKRAHAFINALTDEFWETDASQIKEARAEAEAGRIDLSVVVTNMDGSELGGIIEAKFGHKVTSGQLPKYRRLSQKLADKLTRVVVAPELTIAVAASMRRNREWQFLTWRTFLLRFDKYLAPDSDDEEFRRFRRTIWFHAYDV